MIMEPDGKSLLGIEATMLHLSLKNISLSAVRVNLEF